jgi:trimeric autotransporter adhesin
LGDSAQATQAGAVAVGLNAAATGTNAIAIGNGATATGSIAMGPGASAANGGAAFGDGAVATGFNATAIGTGASATFANSSAFGAGASATAANQMAFGTASNTYRMPGITSAASLAAQSGPTSFVTTDANGNLAATNLSVPNIAGLSANVAALQQGVNFLQSEISANQTEARRGVAVAMAANGFTTPVRAGGTTVGVTGGFFKGESAVGFNIAHRFAAWPGLVGYGSIATTGGNETGGRIGASLEF